MKLRDKVSIITGAGQGIGKAIALAFAKEGAAVVVAGINVYNPSQSVSHLNNVVYEIHSQGGKALAVPTDVRKSVQIAHMVKETVREFGRIDILVNNAGVQKETPFLKIREKEWDWVLDTNLKGAFLCSRLCAEEMSKRRDGRIINISSVHQFIPRIEIAHYAASKGGIMMLTKTMALELAEHGINVNCIAPGAVDTDMNRHWTSDKDKREEMESKIPLRQIAQPEQIAQAAVYLASSDADYITGTTIYIDGGLSLSGLGYKKMLDEQK